MIIRNSLGSIFYKLQEIGSLQETERNEILAFNTSLKMELLLALPKNDDWRKRDKYVGYMGTLKEVIATTFNKGIPNMNTLLNWVMGPIDTWGPLTRGNPIEINKRNRMYMALGTDVTESYPYKMSLSEFMVELGLRDIGQEDQLEDDLPGKEMFFQMWLRNKFIEPIIEESL